MKNHVTSEMATASLVLGIVSIFIGWIPILGWIPSILAIVFGFVSLNNIKKSKKMSGKLLAMWGIFLGAFWLVLLLFIFILILIEWSIFSSI